jgi:hypothetical protein
MKVHVAPMLIGMLLTASATSIAGPKDAAEKSVHGTYIDVPELLNERNGAPRHARLGRSVISVTSSSEPAAIDEAAAAVAPATVTMRILPVWSFTTLAPRDGQHHQGTMVGSSPTAAPATTSVPTQIVPLILRTHTIGTNVDPISYDISTVAGQQTTNPTVADRCLKAPNNIPATVMSQSPVFAGANFNFGGTSFGKTQYVDAFTRANFYRLLGAGQANYHVLLQPVTMLPSIVIDVPANEGLAITDPAFLSIFGLSNFCGTYQLIDINWLDTYINGTVLPALVAHGVNPGTLPVFMLHNAALLSGVTNFSGCCVLGYHGTGGNPVPTQTYSVVGFDTSGFWTALNNNSDSIEDSAVLSHEVAEWVNDPYTVNPAPPWGNVGQVQGCQANLEVGDPLSGTYMPPVLMPNGYTYHLQELAFFSWFFGGASYGVHGWYSNNGTFATDAGPPCP